MPGPDAHLSSDGPTLQLPDVAGVLAGQEGCDRELPSPDHGAVPAYRLHSDDLDAVGLRLLQRQLDLRRLGEARPPRSVQSHEVPAIHGQPDRARQGSLSRASWQADVCGSRLH